MRKSTRWPFGSIFAVFLWAGLTAGCGSSTTTVTAPSTIARCGVTLIASDATIPAEGGSGRITVTTARECAWSAAAEVAWLTIAGANSGQGDGAIEYRVAANADPLVRRGGVVLNNQRAEITQAAAACVIQLRQPSASFPQGGGTGAVDVVASSQMCAWTTASDADWITLTSSAGGTGTASVGFAVAPTTGLPRTGSISIADQRFSVIQSEGCTFTIAPEAQSVGASGGGGTIAVSTAAGCPWTSVSNVPWLSITQGASGNGSGLVTFTVAPTEGPGRTGTLVVAGRAFTVTQIPGCAYEVAPLTHSVAPGGGNLSVNVASAPGCGWTAQSHSDWIGVTGATSGSGSSAVTLSVAATSGPARSGTLTVAGQTVTVSQGGGCTFAITPESQNVAAGGGTGTVNVTAGPGCAWSASSNASWITISQGSSGSGNGAVQFSVAASTGGARSGTMTIAGRTFTVNQGDGCSFVMSPQSAQMPAAGGSTSFTIQTAASCAWTPVSTVPWISIAAGGVGGDGGSGNGTVQLTVAANTAAARTGTVTAGGQTFTVNQDGGCSFTLSAASQNVPAEGGTGSVDVAGDAACAWTAVSDQPWISITSAASGSGSGTVTFSVAANSGPARSGNLTIGGRPFTINQAEACSFAIAPDQQTVPATGGDIIVNVAGAAGCGWTAVPAVPWIAVVSGSSGNGSGSVQLNVAASGEAARSSTAAIAGLTFTVHQASGCTYALSPTGRGAPGGGGDGTFAVETSGSTCAWTAVSDVSWITITQGAGGTGAGTVHYSVSPNPGASRTGTVSVQGQVFTVVQAAGQEEG